MRATLRIHGFECVLERECDCCWPWSAWETKTQKAAIIIQRHVSPSVLSYFPSEDFNDAESLMAHLELLTLRFRFLDLPAELRNRIYGHIFAEDPFIFVSPLDGYCTPYPSTKASRQIRQKSLPLFYSTSKFTLRPSGRWSSKISKAPRIAHREGVGFAAAVRLWSQKVSCAQLKQLRDVDVGLRVDSKSLGCNAGRIFTFTFSAEHGVLVRHPPHLTRGSKDKLDSHMATVEMNRKALGLKGEAIILALIADPHLWDHGALQTEWGRCASTIHDSLDRRIDLEAFGCRCWRCSSKRPCHVQSNLCGFDVLGVEPGQIQRQKMPGDSREGAELVKSPS